jgi:hypothetical protein
LLKRASKALSRTAGITLARGDQRLALRQVRLGYASGRPDRDDIKTATEFFGLDGVVVCVATHVDLVILFEHLKALFATTQTVRQILLHLTKRHLWRF